MCGVALSEDQTCGQTIVRMESYKTFLYAVRDSPALRVKYGYATCPDIDAARRHLESRYATYFFFCELLHVVPVAQKGVEAEAQLKASLLPYYVGREFLSFTDENSLRVELRRAFEEAACSEGEAACRQSKRGTSKGERKRLRQEAELMAAVEVAVIAKKRRLERHEKAQEKRSQRVREQKGRGAGEQWNVELITWLDEHVEACPGAYLTMKDAFAGYKHQQGHLGKVKFGARMKELMIVPFVEQSSREGVHVARFWDGVRLSI